METITRLYDSYADAERAVVALKSAGIPQDDISLVASHVDNRYAAAPTTVDRDGDGRDDRAEGASTGVGIGATLGGAAGLLAGLGIMAIPGVGPVVAAGWLAATALGAVVGGTAGGIVGALTQAGVSEEDAHVYAEGVRRGGTLLTVRVADGRRREVEALLGDNAVDVSQRASVYRDAGWQKFDPAAPTMTPDEIRRERERYRSTM